jgi:hypothetical protein
MHAHRYFLLRQEEFEESDEFNIIYDDCWVTGGDLFFLNLIKLVNFLSESDSSSLD